MKADNISVLEEYQEFFEMVAQKTGYYHKKEGYFAALASRCSYSRILSPKICFLEFQGLDSSSNILTETLKEVFEYRQLKEHVNDTIINCLAFLRVPEDKLKNRRVFEPLILVTLADFIASGRIIVKHSMQYRNKWTDVSDIDIDDENRDRYVRNIIVFR
jgi:hypothetical protein